MIRRVDIDDRVREWGLRDDVVEKDYVLGWVLWGVGATICCGVFELWADFSLAPLATQRCVRTRTRTDGRVPGAAAISSISSTDGTLR
jgi:hypothetical protein